MRKPIYVIFFSILLLAFAIVGYFAGKNSVEPIMETTFYANVEEINGDTLLVNGLEYNDINHRGQYELNIKEDTILEWRSTEITPEDFKIGDTISVTYTGDILDSYPGRIPDLLRIQLLTDEK
ncbi:MAG: hypothetical protein ACRC3H_05270 [Lachnospiraceae bacterium]